jgi:serine/threonine-protein kinase
MGLPPGYRDAVLVLETPRSRRFRALADTGGVELAGPPVLVTVFAVKLDLGERRRVKREVGELLLWPASPHLLPPIGGGVTPEGSPYLVRGEPGARSVSTPGRGPLPEEEAVAAARHAAAGLAALHSGGLVHGAVIPADLVHSPGGVALADPEPGTVVDRLGPAEPAMTAPEVLQGRPASSASDVYGLAVTLVTLLIGRPLYQLAPGEEVGDLLLRMLAGPAPDLVSSGVPPALAGVLSRAVAVDPGVRPAAAELADQLAGVVAASSSARPDTHLESAETLPPTATIASLGPTLGGPLDAGVPLGSRYVLRERLGSGAMGVVWQGVQRDGMVPVAVKLLRTELTDDHALVARFLQERSTLVNLRHPNLVRVHDLVAEGSTLAIVMELVVGRNLRQHLRTVDRLAPGPACKLLAQLADGLAAVHVANVVHRDLKPENVLLERPEAGDPVVRLTDFGVARSASGPALTRIDQLIGTPEYLAPELAAGRSAGAAADVYAMGVIAYEMVAGRRPFEAEHPAALLRAHMDLAPYEPPGIDQRLWRLVAACLAKDPGARPTAAELGLGFAELGSALAEAPPLAPFDMPSLETALRPGPAPRPDATGGERIPGHEGARDHGPDRPGPDEHSGELATMAGTVLPLLRPGAVVARKSRRLLYGAIVAAIVVVGVVTGGFLQANDAPESTSSTTARPPSADFVPLTTQAVPGGPGTVTLTFEDASARPGFRGYRVFRDENVPLPDRVAAGVTFLQVGNLPPGSPHCFVVYAVVARDPNTTTTTNKATKAGAPPPTVPAPQPSKACTTVG